MISKRKPKRRFKNNHGYWRVKCENHPNCSNTGYVLEHRLVMEKKIGRYLARDELVHHIDGNRENNNINNLEICSHQQHDKEHVKDRHRYSREDWEKSAKKIHLKEDIKELNSMIEEYG